MKSSVFVLVALLVLRGAAAPVAVEQWGLFEAALPGPADGNPFTEVRFTATFTHGGKSVDVTGFYDGDGIYRVRFMPDAPGEWSDPRMANGAPLVHLAG